MNFLFYCYYFFFIYIKMSKALSAKCYQKNKERLRRKFVEDIKIFLRKKKKKKREYGRERQKNLSENEKKSLLSIEKNIIEGEKALYHNYENTFSFRKLCFFIKKSIET